MNFQTKVGLCCHWTDSCRKLIKAEPCTVNLAAIKCARHTLRNMLMQLKSWYEAKKMRREPTERCIILQEKLRYQGHRCMKSSPRTWSWYKISSWQTNSHVLYVPNSCYTWSMQFHSYGSLIKIFSLLLCQSISRTIAFMWHLSIITQSALEECVYPSCISHACRSAEGAIGWRVAAVWSEYCQSGHQTVGSPSTITCP